MKADVPEVFNPLMKYLTWKVGLSVSAGSKCTTLVHCLLLQVERTLSAGLGQVTWGSLNVQDFLKRIENVTAGFERFTMQVQVLYVSLDQLKVCSHEVHLHTFAVGTLALHPAGE